MSLGKAASFGKRTHVDFYLMAMSQACFVQRDTTLYKMRLFKRLLCAVTIAASISSAVAASWTFTDGTVSVSSKGTGVGSGDKQK